MAFPPQFLDELRARIPVTSVVGRRVKLVRKGREHQGLCPFHNEKTPSFTVNEDKGFFHCFGCGAHGDAIGFEMRAGHLSFTEAVEKLAAEAGIEVPKASPEERVREQRRASLHDALEAACGFFEKHLKGPAGREGFAYLKNRGLSDETIARFRLGFAPDSREALKSALMSKECPESLLIEAGLLKKPESGASFDYFRGRVMFPITDRRGRVIGFGARTLGDGQPKYLNSPDTPLFHKGQTLYGLAHAREMARELNRVVVVEGYMDVIAMHQAGFAYAVAPLGTAVTEAQIEELWRLAPEPILCLDGDAAGQRAMARALERAFPILKPGLSLRFAALPSPEDPDSLIKARGPAAMATVLDSAQAMVEVAWRLALENRPLDTPEARALLDKDLAEKAFSIADEAVRFQYLATFRQKAKDHFRPKWEPRKSGSGFGKPSGRFGGPPQAPLKGPDGLLPGAGRPRPPQPNSGAQEWMMLALVLDHPRLMDSIGERLGETTFTDKTLDNLRRGILKHLGAARDLDADGLATHLRTDGYSEILDHFLDTNERRLRALRGDLSTEEARTHWEHVYNLYTRKDLLADVSEANAELAQGPTAASWSRFEAVKKQQQTASALDDEASGNG
ncbi:DNA primase [Paramagnetospirillum magnetotacticum MS-1]|uniref:DNA primase n=1 Tax=Paramagnetospirillum magnetotacticum MS-1 TaxID=272627 RepID=A0A0C2YAK3_PARME|nr:DNA primase [Paramagnetospirillum magnetotacticum]KIL96779.1 DNA primase [Paramagnetospirillum magnetotacticum MS-1]